MSYLVDTYPNRGINIVRGEGVYLYDNLGNEYLDLMSNYGVDIFGHSHPEIIQKLIFQLRNLTTLHGSFGNRERTQAAYKLVERCGGGLGQARLPAGQVYFCNSGTEAVEAALKFAVLATGKRKFIACINGYHGKTLGALSATYGEKYRATFVPLLWNFVHIPFNDVSALKKELSDEVAAFIVEPIQGESGIVVPDNGYLAQVERICRERGILLILDEIQTGMGRTGKFLASTPEVEAYDILCLGKGLAGGVPVGATLVSRKVGMRIPKHIHTSTFGGNPLACAGILAVLELLDESRLSHVRDMGDYFRDELKKIDSSRIKAVRGKGLMIGMVIDEKRNEVLKLLQQNHVLAIPAGSDVVRFLPPYVIEKKQVDIAVAIIESVLRRM